ncbi:ATP-binding protein [Streptomyces cinerochromogenes]|uniref:ATP-binding protein n=1 Tax=Streptomyces cinerochromogenes TaxID=66422 RepID=UPI0033A2ABDA
MNHDNCLPRSELQVPFAAEPREVPALRRIIRQHLAHWGLLGVVDAAQLCVSELATNVIKHVGVGVPATLVVSMEGTNLRLEVRDPSMEQLPRAVRTEGEEEDGRGLALVDAMSQKWGVCLRADGKATWCELATTLTSPHGHVPDHRVSRADKLLTSYGQQVCCTLGLSGSPVTRATEDAVRLIADLLHWVEAHGLDPEATLERARSCFESVSAW